MQDSKRKSRGLQVLLRLSSERNQEKFQKKYLEMMQKVLNVVLMALARNQEKFQKKYFEMSTFLTFITRTNSVTHVLKYSSKS